MCSQQQLRVGSLFSGIGGFDLGFERAGMRTEWFAECEPFCQAVLRKHWPEVPCYEDVRSVTASLVRPVDVLCGGFPCQDLSSAGKGAGLDGARSGLWSEFARLIGELRPRYVVVENVPMLRTRGLGRVLGEVAALGYDAEWDCIPAAAVGAPQKRDRIWIIAYPHSNGEHGLSVNAEVAGVSPMAGGSHTSGAARTVADPAGVGGRSGVEEAQHAGTHRGESLDSGSTGGGDYWWATEPDVGRVAHGVPARMDRLRSLGNALVPQIAEWIGHQIVEWERVNG